MTEATNAPAPHADVSEILATVLNSITSNRGQVLRRREELVLELEQNKLIEKQFNTMIAGVNLLASDPFALKQVADRLAADEAAKVAPVEADSPSAEAGAADSEGSAASAAEVPSSAGDVGAAAVEVAVANDASAAS